MRTRALETKARADADAGTFEPPLLPKGWETYQAQALHAMWCVVYREQFTKRTARNARKQASSAIVPPPNPVTPD